jgi:hypothetical protein
MPSALRDEQTLARLPESATKPTGWWSNTPKYIVSLLKAYYGDAATPENDFCFDYLPQIAGDYSTLPTQIVDEGRQRRRLLRHRHESGGVGHERELARAAIERLQWMVVIDAYETETASFWRREGADPRRSAPRCSSSHGDRARKRGHDGQHQSHVAVARQGRRTRGRRALRPLSLPPARLRLKQLYAVRPIRRTADPRSHLGLSAATTARTRARRTLGGQGAARDQRLRGRARQIARRMRASRRVRRSQGRRLDRMRLLDLLRRVSRQRRRTARAIAHGRRLDVARLGLRVARKPAHALQSRLGRSRRQAVERTQEVHVLGRGREEVGRPRRSRFSGRQVAARTGEARRERVSTRIPAAIRSSCNSTAARSSSCPARSKTARCRRTTSRWNRRANPLYAQQNNPTLREWNRDDNPTTARTIRTIPTCSRPTGSPSSPAS